MINILDKEKPNVYNCPNNIEQVLDKGQNEIIVHWKEPQFEDNVRIAHTYKSYVSIYNTINFIFY